MDPWNNGGWMDMQIEFVLHLPHYTDSEREKLEGRQINRRGKREEKII